MHSALHVFSTFCSIIIVILSKHSNRICLTYERLRTYPISELLVFILRIVTKNPSATGLELRDTFNKLAINKCFLFFKFRYIVIVSNIRRLSRHCLVLHADCYFKIVVYTESINNNVEVSLILKLFSSKTWKS